MAFERCVSFNPMSLVQSCRKEDIHQYYKDSADVIALQGTRERQRDESHSHSLYHLDDYINVVAGYGGKSNKHAGVSLSFCKRRFREDNLISIATPGDKKLQGRALAIRTKRPNLDITYIVAYFPPPDSSGSSIKVYVLLAAWLREVLWSLPSRTTPILLTDSNAHLACVDHACPIHVGAFNDDRLNRNGEVFLELLQDTALCATNTFRDNKPTFYSGTSSACSRVDYVCVPVASFHIHKSFPAAHVSLRDGKRLQLARSSRRIDHQPLIQSYCIFNLTQYDGPAPSLRWNHDELVSSIMKGTGRQQFFDDLSKRVDAIPDDSECFSGTNPSKIYSALLDVVRSPALEHFACKDSKDTYAIEFKKQRNAILLQRRNVKGSSRFHAKILVTTGDVFEQWAYLAKLQRLSKKIKHCKTAHFKLVNENRRVELIQAWRTRDLAMAWRLSRLIANTKKGPKRRWGKMTSTARPSVEQWKEKLITSGPKGGWKATFLEMQDVSDFMDEEHELCNLDDLNLIKCAERDFKDLRWQMRKSKCRKGVPSDDVPNEIWRLVFLA
jgi:exonuclease III